MLPDQLAGSATWPFHACRSAILARHSPGLACALLTMHAHYDTGMHSTQIKFEHLAQFGGKGEKSGLVPDDALVKAFHRELRGHRVQLRGYSRFHQKGVPLAFQGAIVRSSRI